MAQGPVIRIGVNAEALERAGDVQGALKLVQRDIKQIEKDALKIEKKGGQITDTMKDNARKLEALESRLKGTLQAQARAASMIEGKNAADRAVADRLGFGRLGKGGSFGTRDFSGARRDINDVVSSARGFAAGDVGSGLGELFGRGGPLGSITAGAGLAGIGALLAIEAAKTSYAATKTLNKDESENLKTLAALRSTIVSIQGDTGVRGTNKLSQELSDEQFQKEVAALTLNEKAARILAGKSDQGQALLALFGLNDDKIRAKGNAAIEDAIKQQKEQIDDHVKAFDAAASLGDTQRAVTEVNAIAGIKSANQFVADYKAKNYAAMGSSTEAYLRADRLRFADSQYTTIKSKRGSLRIGD